jgi:arylformamidase
MLYGTPYEYPDDISRQLDLVRSYADLSPYMEFLNIQSQKTVEALNPMVDVRIGARDEERLDVFCSRQEKSPIVIFIHGGWWHKNTRKVWNYAANGFWHHGFSVIVSDYALCPKVAIADQTQASRAAVAWAYEHADEINGDRERIFVVGHSAGGHLAAMLAVTDWTEYGLPADVLKGVAPMSGIYDLHVIKACYIQTYVHLTVEEVLSQSPLFNLRERASPMQIMVGDEESVEFHRQADLFVDACRAKGFHIEYQVLPEEDHSTYVFDLCNPLSKTVKSIVEFFKTC